MNYPIHLPHGFTAFEESDVGNDSATSKDRASFAISDRTRVVCARISLSRGWIVGIVAVSGMPLALSAAEAVESFLAYLDLPIMCPTDAIGGRIMDSMGRFHDLAALPDDLHVKGWLFFHKEAMVRLPARRLTVDHGLYLVDCTVETFPSDHLRVGDSATLHGSNVTRLPKGTYVGGDLSLSGEMTSLPDGLNVGRILRLGGSRVSVVPDGTVCGGPIMFDSGQIETLPASVHDETMVYIFDHESERTFHTCALWCRNRAGIMEERRVLRERLRSRKLLDKFKDLVMGRPSLEKLLSLNHERSMRLSMGIRD